MGGGGGGGGKVSVLGVAGRWNGDEDGLKGGAAASQQLHLYWYRSRPFPRPHPQRKSLSCQFQTGKNKIVDVKNGHENRSFVFCEASAAPLQVALPGGKSC